MAATITRMRFATTENPQQDESDQASIRMANSKPRQQHRDLKIERLLRLLATYGIVWPLVRQMISGPSIGEQHQAAERDENEPRAARSPQQAAQMRRHRPIPLFAAEFAIP